MRAEKAACEGLGGQVLAEPDDVRAEKLPQCGRAAGCSVAGQSGTDGGAEADGYG